MAQQPHTWGEEAEGRAGHGVLHRGHTAARGSPCQPDPSTSPVLLIPLSRKKTSLNSWRPDQHGVVEAACRSWQCPGRRGAGLSCWVSPGVGSATGSLGRAGSAVASPFPCLHPRGLLSLPAMPQVKGAEHVLPWVEDATGDRRGLTAKGAAEVAPDGASACPASCLQLCWLLSRQSWGDWDGLWGQELCCLATEHSPAPPACSPLSL